MTTLTFADFVIISLINLVIIVIVTYAVNYAKRSAELSVEENSGDKEYLKKVIRLTVNETRDILTELRVHEFKVPTGRRRLSRMNSLIEKLNMADSGLGDLVWKLVTAPTVLDVKKTEVGTAGSTYKLTMINDYLKDLELALRRCTELEKNPVV